MSDKSEDLTRWFRETYPVEIFFLSEITKKVNEVFQNPSLKAHPSFKENEIKNLRFGITNRNGKLELNTSLAGMFFLGCVGKAIFDVVASHIQVSPTTELETGVRKAATEAAKDYVTHVNPILFQNPKRCPNCQYENVESNRHCSECGTKLNSS